MRTGWRTNFGGPKHRLLHLLFGWPHFPHTTIYAGESFGWCWSALLRPAEWQRKQMPVSLCVCVWPKLTAQRQIIGMCMARTTRALTLQRESKASRQRVPYSICTWRDIAPTARNDNKKPMWCMALCRPFHQTYHTTRPFFHARAGQLYNVCNGAGKMIS